MTPKIGFQFTTRRGVTAETWTVTKVTAKRVSFTTDKGARSAMSLENFQRMFGR